MTLSTVNSSSSSTRKNIAALISPRALEISQRIQEETARNIRSFGQWEEARDRIRREPSLLRRFAPRSISRSEPSPTLSIHSPFDMEENQSIKGILRGSATNASIYVDSRINASTDDAALTSLLQFYDTISLPRIRTLFGHESDVNQDGRITIFFASKDKVGVQNVGFFRLADLLPDGSIIGIRSNEREIIYVRAPDSTTPIEVLHATLAHETFHLVNFAIKNLARIQQMGGAISSPESLFLNEGLAHLTEDLVGWGADSALVTKIYLDCFSQTSLAGSGIPTGEANPLNCGIVAGGEDSLPRRGGMMLFLLYLFQQHGGAVYSEDSPGDISGRGIDFLHEMNSSNLYGIANIEKSSGSSFFNIYGHFLGAISLDHTPAAFDSSLQFAPEVTDPFTHMKRNVRTHMTRIDIDGSKLVLDGPKISAILGEGNPFDGTIFLSGADALPFPLPAGKNLHVKITGDSSASLGISVATVE